jgi:hypothetical protein
LTGRSSTTEVAKAADLDAVIVTVEAHVGPGLPGLSVIGSSGAAARESADRVRTAVRRIRIPACGRGPVDRRRRNNLNGPRLARAGEEEDGD